MRRLALATSRAAALAACLLPLAASTAVAADFEGGDAVRIDANETIHGDLFAFGRSVVVNGTVEGDLVASAFTIELNGEVTGSIDAAGASVSLGGTAGGSVRAAAGDVTVSGDIAGDLVASAGTLTIDDEARVGGDVAGGLGTADINGTVAGDFIADARDLRINGTVRGDVESNLENLTLGPTARVSGDVRYTSAHEADVDSGAAIGGVLQRTQPARATGPGSILPEHPLVTFAGLTAGLLLLGWLMLLLRPASIVGIGRELRTRPLLALGAGLAGWIGQFLLVIVLVLLSVVVAQVAGPLGGALLFIALIGALLIVALALVAQVYIAAGLGDLVTRFVRVSPWLAYAAGAVVVAAVLTVAGLNPVVFLFAYLLLWILGLGGFLLYEARRRQADGPLAILVTAPTGLAPAGAPGRSQGRGAGSPRTADHAPSRTRRGGIRPAPALAPTARRTAAVPVGPAPASRAGLSARDGDSGDGSTSDLRGATATDATPTDVAAAGADQGEVTPAPARIERSEG
ncbi:MAG: hypothetical protein ABR509_05155 [Candidatus Limnocylindria bacterium]